MDKWRVQWGQGEVSRPGRGSQLAGAGGGPEEAEIPGGTVDLPGLRAPGETPASPQWLRVGAGLGLWHADTGPGGPRGPEDGSPSREA